MKPTDGKEPGGQAVTSASAVASVADSSVAGVETTTTVAAAAGDETGVGDADGSGEIAVDGKTASGSENDREEGGEEGGDAGEGDGNAAGGSANGDGENGHAGDNGNGDGDNGGDEPDGGNADDAAAERATAATSSAAPVSMAGIDEIEVATGCGDDGGPSSLMGMGPPSPLTGCYLLIVLGEPHSQEHKDIILQRLIKGMLLNI